MAEHNTSIEVGAAQSFGTSYAPRRTNMGTSTGNWTYGYGSYPAPYRSFSQNLVNSNWILGPYCRRLDGVAGRLKISTQAEFGEIGFAQQCWYDFPRGANDKVNGVLQSSNKVWWDTEVSGKYWIRVYNLNDDNAPLIWVQVAVNGGGGNNPPLSMHDVSNGPLQGDCIRHIRAAHNLYGGQVNPLQLYTGIAGNCGIKSDTLSSLAIPYSATNGAWLPDVSFLENGGMAGCPWVLDPNGEAEEELGNIYNGLNGTQQAAAGASFSDANRSNNLLGWISTHLGNVKDFLEKLRSWAYTEAANETADRNAAIKATLELLSAAPMAAELMMHGWFLPNLRKYGSGNGVTGTASNPYKWRPPNHVQQRFASYLLDNGTSGAPFGGGTDFKAYIPGSTPNKKDDDGNTTSEPDWGWHLTLLNRGDTTTVPYVDPATNEFVFAENYGFNRGGSVQSADPFLNWVDSKFGTQTGDSIGTLIDMSPAAPFFIVTVIPIVALEVGGQLIKAKKGESIGSGGNLDGYDTTKFETRISASNMKAGNPTMYNYLVNTGDANGNKFTAVP